MSFKILTTDQYDATKYQPAGSIVINRVETISMLRGFVGGITGMFGGKNDMIQGAMDRLTSRGVQDFKEKVAASYPQTALVVGFDSMVTDIGRDEQNQYIVIHLKGTCLVPIGAAGAATGARSNQAGGTRRAKTRKGLRRGLAF